MEQAVSVKAQERKAKRKKACPFDCFLSIDWELGTVCVKIGGPSNVSFPYSQKVTPKNGTNPRLVFEATSVTFVARSATIAGKPEAKASEEKDCEQELLSWKPTSRDTGGTSWIREDSPV